MKIIWNFPLIFGAQILNWTKSTRSSKRFQLKELVSFNFQTERICFTQNTHYNHNFSDVLLKRSHVQMD